MLSMANLSDENSRFFFNQVKLGPLKPWITEQYFFIKKHHHIVKLPKPHKSPKKLL